MCPGEKAPDLGQLWVNELLLLIPFLPYRSQAGDAWIYGVLVFAHQDFRLTRRVLNRRRAGDAGNYHFIIFPAIRPMALFFSLFTIRPFRMASMSFQRRRAQ